MATFEVGLRVGLLVGLWVVGFLVGFLEGAFVVVDCEVDGDNDDAEN